MTTYLCSVPIAKVLILFQLFIRYHHLCILQKPKLYHVSKGLFICPLYLLLLNLGFKASMTTYLCSVPIAKVLILFQLFIRYHHLCILQKPKLYHVSKGLFICPLYLLLLNLGFLAQGM